MTESGTFETREGNGAYIGVEDAPSPKRARFENAVLEQTEIVQVSVSLARCYNLCGLAVCSRAKFNRHNYWVCVQYMYWPQGLQTVLPARDGA